MSLTVTVLGCSGSFAAAGGACSGYLVEGAGTRVWLDAGAGTLGNLQRHVALTDIDAIVVSHSHPDHWVELPIARNALRYVLGGEAVPVYTTASTRKLVERVGGKASPTFRWHDVEHGARFSIGEVSVRAARTDHPVETLAFRFERDGASFVYSADTGPAWDGGSLGPTDLLIAEASLEERDEGRVQHLSARQAAQLATRIGAERLVLTHVVPGVDPEAQRRAAEAELGRPVELARIDGRFEIAPS